MTIAEIVDQRGICEILHFTTDKGLVGTLAKAELLSRMRLPEEDLLRFIFTANCDTRKDPAWLDYVSMSITKVNPRFFDYSIERHKNDRLWWCVLAFDPEILSHEGVYFTTTNNIYTRVQRAPGPEGLLALFDSQILQYVRRGIPQIVNRSPSLPANVTTCSQAEVLYPQGVSIEYLRAIYVPNEDLRARALALAKVLRRNVNVVVRPELFTNKAASGC